MKHISKINNKIMTLLLIICILFMYLPVVSFAETNTGKEVGLDLNSVNISNRNVTVGDKVKISFRINNISGEIKYVDAYYSKPTVKTLTDKISFRYNMENGCFEHEFEVTDTYVNGEYLFNRLMISIGNYSETYYNSENENINNYGQIIDLNVFNFNVYGTKGDDTPPSIVSSSLNISSNKAVIGDTITYKVKVLENTSIKNVNIKLANQTGRYEYTYKTLNMTYNPISQLFEAKLIVDAQLLSGYWYINNIYAIDTFNNSYTLYNTQFYSSGTFTPNKGYTNLAKATFKNFQEYPNAKLIDNTINVENANVTVGDNLKISMTISDDFGIDNVKLFYNHETKNEQIVLKPVFEKTKYTTSSSYGNVTYFITTTDIYTLNKEIDKYGWNANWILDRIEVENTAGHITKFYNKQVYPYSLIDLSSGNFTTYGLTENEIEVESENITLENNQRNYQLKYNVILNGNIENKAKFKSLDESVARVSPTGLVTAQGNGNTSIIITSEDESISKEINVNVSMDQNLHSINTNLLSNGKNDETSIAQLLNDSKEEIFRIEMIGNNNDFVIPSIENGEYTLRISKKSNTTREYKITVEDTDINIETEISLIGDATGDGKVNNKDWEKLYKYINGTGNLDEYEFLCSDVNHDGKVNNKDWNRLYSHINETNLLY